MNSVIVFDITHPERIHEIKNEMMNLGYYVVWNSINSDGSRTTYNLPHNMIWRQETDGSRAIADLQAVITSINNRSTRPPFQLLRCIVLNSTPWFGVVGSPV